MDPVSHVLFGALTVAAARPRALRPLAVTGAAGSVLPDLDVLLVPAGWDRYLMVHEVGSHSLLGATLLGALLALLVRRRVAAPLAVTGAAALAGTLGHVFWDVASGAEIRLFWPLASVRLGGHLVAMADPFVLALLVCGAAGALLWPRRGQPVAAMTLLALAGLLCGKLLLQQASRVAYEAAVARRGEAVTATAQDARWGSITGWWIYDRTGLRLRTWHVDAWTGRATLLSGRPMPAVDDRIARSRSAPAVQHAIALFEFAFADVALLAGGGYEVRWSDIRFCDGSKRCDVWFGAQYAADGAPVQQVVRVGTLVQTRPMPHR